MFRYQLVLAACVAVVASGCAGGPNAFQDVNLRGDLSASALERYQQEAGMSHSSGHGSHGHAGHMMKLESENWWGLGLLAYWKQGKAVAMGSGAGRYYMVAKSRGYGPLALPFVMREQAVFDADGKRQSYMMTSSIAWGHIAMAHYMGSRLSDGTWMGHSSVGVMHHMVNVGAGHGATVSFFSAPNPVGFGQ